MLENLKKAKNPHKKKKPETAWLQGKIIEWYQKERGV